MNLKLMALSALLLISTNSHALDLTIGTLISPTLTSDDLKEQEGIIRADAIDFLAGNEATEVLLMLIEEVKQKYPETQDLSNEEIATMLITK